MDRQQSGNRLLKQLFLMVLALKYLRNMMENKEAENCDCFDKVG
jgi:hypothetical protein